jgi:HEAT repeat protein
MGRARPVRRARPATARAPLSTVSMFGVAALLGVAVLLGAACGGSKPPPPPPSAAMLPLPAAQPGDPAAEGAPYLALVAARLGPEWRHFLDDCRLRLPAEHPLNSLALEARATLIVDRSGALVGKELATSGNADFDTAITEILAAIGPLPAPPSWLLSDDDKLRLSWLFARDARQASAAHAEVRWLEEPAPQVVERRLAAGDLAGAARRLARLTDDDPALRPEARRVFLAAISEGLHGAGPVQRAAIEAVRRAGLVQLAPRLVPLVADADPALRAAAAAALAAIGDATTAKVLLEQLAATRDPQLAATLARALAALGPAASPEPVVLRLADGDRDAQLTALAALAELTVTPALATRVTRWSTSKDPGVRSALCASVARAKLTATTRWQILGRGLDDRDGSARAACTAALALAAIKPQPWMRTALRQRVDDRDQRVRAAAITASMRWDPTRLDDRLRALAADPDPSIRTATVAALSRRGEVQALRALLGDADPGVRRTAALALVLVDGAAVRERALRDPDARVRLVALELKGDLVSVLKALANDESPEVRTEVEVLFVANRGESLQSGLLRLSGADAASGDRVRIAMAWLLAT